MSGPDLSVMADGTKILWCGDILDAAAKETAQLCKELSAARSGTIDRVRTRLQALSACLAAPTPPAAMPVEWRTQLTRLTGIVRCHLTALYGRMADPKGRDSLDALLRAVDHADAYERAHADAECVAVRREELAKLLGHINDEGRYSDGATPCGGLPRGKMCCGCLAAALLEEIGEAP